MGDRRGRHWARRRRWIWTGCALCAPDSASVAGATRARRAGHRGRHGDRRLRSSASPAARPSPWPGPSSKPSRVERLVLVDLAGSPDERSAVPVVAFVSQLGTVYPSAQAAIALIKQIGMFPSGTSTGIATSGTSCARSTAAWRRATTEARCSRIAGTATRCTGRARMRRSTRCGTRSPCRRWRCAPGRRSCRGSGPSCPPRRRSGSRRRCRRQAWRRSTRSLHDHDARRFHRCHRCVPAHKLTQGQAASASG